MRKPIDTFIRIVHAQRHTLALEIIHLHLGRLASVCRCKGQCQLSGSGSDIVGRAVLIPKGMTANDDGFCPSGYGLGDRVEDDGFAKDGTA